MLRIERRVIDTSTLERKIIKLIKLQKLNCFKNTKLHRPNAILMKIKRKNDCGYSGQQ